MATSASDSEWVEITNRQCATAYWTASLEKKWEADPELRQQAEMEDMVSGFGVGMG